MHRSPPASSPSDDGDAAKLRSRSVLRDAVELYVQASMHDRSEIRAFGDLVDGLLADAGFSERRFIAETLAKRSDVPPGLALRLALDSADIAAPMIVASPVLTSADLVQILRRGPDHVRLVAERLDLGDDLAAVLIDSNFAQPTTRRATSTPVRAPAPAVVPVAAAKAAPVVPTPVPDISVKAPVAPVAVAARSPDVAVPARVEKIAVPVATTATPSTPTRMEAPMVTLPASLPMAAVIAPLPVAAPSTPTSADLPTETVSPTVDAVRRRLDVPDRLAAAVAEAVAMPAATPSPANAAMMPSATTIAPNTGSDATPSVADTVPRFRVPLRGEAPARETAEPRERVDFLDLDGAGRWRVIQEAAAEAALAPPPRPKVGLDVVALTDRLFAAAVAHDRVGLALDLREALDVDAATAARVAADPSGEPLAVALAALGVEERRATSILLLTFGETADLAHMQDLAAMAGRIGRRTAEQLVSKWRGDKTGRRPETRRGGDGTERREVPSAKTTERGADGLRAAVEDLARRSGEGR